MQVRVARHTDRLAEIVRFYRDGLGLIPHPDSLLVFYLGSTDAVSEACERADAQPVEPANPYWKAHGVTLVDPDGFRVVLVPDSWVAG